MLKLRTRTAVLILPVAAALMVPQHASAGTPQPPPPSSGARAVTTPGGLAAVGSVMTLGQVAPPILGSKPTGHFGVDPGGPQPAPPPPLCAPTDSGAKKLVKPLGLHLDLKSGTNGANPDSVDAFAAGAPQDPQSTYQIPTTLEGFPVEGANQVQNTAGLNPQAARDIAVNQMYVTMTLGILEYTCVPTPCPGATTTPPTQCGSTVANGRWTGYAVDNKPQIASPAPPAPPPTPTLDVPGMARDIVTNWNKGTAVTMPAAATYVHVPTCAWIQGAEVPTPEGNWANVYAREEPAGGGKVWVEYQVVLTVTSGPIVYNWDAPGAGKDEQTELNNPPTGRPRYDAVNQTWPVADNPCNGPASAWHAYDSVKTNPGRHITATKPFSVSAEWYYNIGAGTQYGGVLSCPGCNSLPVTWDFGTHDVYQIQGIPYFA